MPSRNVKESGKEILDPHLHSDEYQNLVTFRELPFLSFIAYSTGRLLCPQYVAIHLK